VVAIKHTAKMPMLSAMRRMRRVSVEKKFMDFGSFFFFQPAWRVAKMSANARRGCECAA
jgi:hypothetical protein